VRRRHDDTPGDDVSVTPLEQDEVEDGGFFSRRGVGNRTVEIVKPDPEGARQQVQQFEHIRLTQHETHPCSTDTLSPPRSATAPA
jgi:hypothetical protein